MNEQTYACRVCDRHVTIKEGEPAPMCCEREMDKLPLCTTVPHPEMIRNYDEEEPCADGTVPERFKKTE